MIFKASSRRFATLAVLYVLALGSGLAGAMPAQAQPAASSAAPLGAAAPSRAPEPAPGAPPARLIPVVADTSLAAMVRHAGGVVQAVMAGLAIASVLSWTILLAKGFELFAAGREVRRAQHLAENDASSPIRPPRVLLLMRNAVQAEIAASPGASASGTKERLGTRMHRLELRLARQAQRGTGVLATIGTTAPFVGLFGTVWGIMNSFVGIARLHTTNLSVVAPGIAEALLATATGLVAAIPAVIIYNIFTRWIGAYRAAIADLAETVLRHAARAIDLDLPEQGFAHVLEPRQAAE